MHILRGRYHHRREPLNGLAPPHAISRVIHQHHFVTVECKGAYHPCRIHSSRSREDSTRSVYSQSSPRSSAISRMYRNSIGGRSFSTRWEKFLTASRSRRTASIH